MAPENDFRLCAMVLIQEFPRETMIQERTTDPK